MVSLCRIVLAMTDSSIIVGVAGHGNGTTEGKLKTWWPGGIQATYLPLRFCRPAVSVFLFLWVDNSLRNRHRCMPTSLWVNWSQFDECL